MEIRGYKGTELARIIINFILDDDDIVFLARSHAELDKKLRTLHDFYSNMGMTINTDKYKVTIIKSKNINHGNYVYDNNFLEYVSYYKYLGINFHHQLNWNYRIEKRIN